MGMSTGLRRPPKLLSRTLLLFLGVTTFIVGTWGQDCNSNADVIPASVTSVVQFDSCQNVWAAERYNLRYKQNTSGQTLGVLLSVPNDGRWHSMGFNTAPASMPGTEAVIFWLDATTSAPNVGNYTIRGKSRDSIVPGSSLKFIVAPAVTTTNEYMYLTYVVEQSATDTVFANLNLAKGPNGDTAFQQQHERYDSLSIDYTTGAVSVQTSNTDDIRKAHGILNIIGWGVLLPVGAIVARYARAYDPTWFYMHGAFQLIGYILIIAGFALGFKLENDLNGVEGLGRHKRLAILLFILATIQITAVLFRPKKDAKVRRFWNWGHWWIGRIALVLAAVNIFVGFHVADASKKWKVAYGVILTLEILTVIPLEILYWIKYLRNRDEPRLPQTAQPRRDFESAGFDSSAPRDPPPPYGASNWDNKY